MSKNNSNGPLYYGCKPGSKEWYANMQQNNILEGREQKVPPVRYVPSTVPLPEPTQSEREAFNEYMSQPVAVRVIKDVCVLL